MILDPSPAVVYTAKHCQPPHILKIQSRPRWMTCDESGGTCLVAGLTQAGVEAAALLSQQQHAPALAVSHRCINAAYRAEAMIAELRKPARLSSKPALQICLSCGRRLILVAR